MQTTAPLHSTQRIRKTDTPYAAMMLYFVVLITTATLLATTNVASATEAPQTSILVTPSVVLSKGGAPGDLASMRRLRTNKAAAEDTTSTEERGIAFSGIEKLVTSSAKKAQLKLWLTQKKSADVTFNLLNLARKKNFLFGSKEFLTWAKYVTKLKKNDAGIVMINTLLKHYDEGTLARLIAGIKTSNSPTMQKLATTLQEAQFTKWMKESRRPVAVEAKLHGLGRGMYYKMDDEIVNAYRYFIGAA
ncbi:hypothetical protein L914_14333 [Phytophthora nicotianae]|uniref:RxLR effector protein n=3 Tax=Phytophthora nicotianae TaxID=4792 RepID=V9ELX9_PHYNI|nr:hypothetical protein F443_14918 [Phytophthora nicotianae P1569]ETM39528.1 hypothetical protein L914_14333 [Phytophthora nicotianae]